MTEMNARPMRPFDERGLFVPTACRNPDCDGKLVYQGHGSWECDGLVDPDDPTKELECCHGYDHIDGDPYRRSLTERQLAAVSR